MEWENQLNLRLKIFCQSMISKKKYLRLYGTFSFLFKNKVIDFKKI